MLKHIRELKSLAEDLGCTVRKVEPGNHVKFHLTNQFGVNGKLSFGAAGRYGSAEANNRADIRRFARKEPA